MKFNLKNRPKWKKQFDRDELHDYASECFHWFQGFAKELRAIHSGTFDTTVGKTIKRTIEEILGE